MTRFRNWNLSRKISFVFVSLLVVVLIVAGSIAAESVTRAVRDVLDTNLRGQAELATKLTEELADKALQIATIVSELEGVRDAYLNPDEAAGRQQLEAVVRPLITALKRTTGAQDFRVHFHKAPAVSFYRTWTDQAGDDLSGFRATILRVAETEQPLKAMELGRGGFVIRGIAPVMEGDRYLGSLEVYYQPTEIVRFLDSELRTGIVLLVNEEAAQALFFEEDYERAFQGRIGDSLISAVTDDWFDPREILDPAALERVTASGEVLVDRTGDFEIAYMPLRDFSGEIAGHVVNVVDVSVLRVAAADRIRLMLLILAAFTILGALFTGFFTYRAISVPVTATADGLKQIASGAGDLSLRLPARRGDEIGRVERHFNAFLENLSETVKGVRSAAFGLEGSARELDLSAEEAGRSATSINGLVERVAQQISDQNQSISQSSSSVEQINGNIASLEQIIGQLASSIDESAAAVEEMAANISSITRNLENVDNYVDRLVDASGHGREMISGVTKRIDELARQSEQLQQANQLIASVAAQTNLLAMNAAIEAAHAGEYGRGFAVVAEEIRNLAEHSAEQSKIISGELKKTQQHVANAVTASGEADEAFTSMREMVDTVKDLETSVRDSLREQEVAGQSVMGNLHQMKEMGGQVNGGIGEIAEGSRMILNEVTKLVEISRQVTSIMTDISGGSTHIETTLDQVRELARRNRELLQGLNAEVGRFRLEEPENQGAANKNGTP